MIGLFRRHYGANPLHLLAHLAAFAIVAFAFAQIVAGGTVINFAVWFVGAAVLHDLVALPLYSVLNRIAHVGIIRAAEARFTPDLSAYGVPVINHIRAPAVISGVLLLVYFPVIFGPGDSTYFAATGHHLHGYGRNWLLITAVLFSGSALVYAVRVRGAARAVPDEPPAS